MIGRRVIVASLLTVCATGHFAHAAAQAVGGQLVIVVTDPTGGRVADAVAVLARGAERRTITARQDGTIQASGLAPGEWRLTVTRDGFVPLRRTVTVGTVATDVAVSLEVAGLTETVSVEGGAGPPTQVPLQAPATGGTRLDLPVRELPASLFLLGQDLIQERGARSVEEAVQLAVGMTASTGVGSIPGYATRGWSGNNISLMRDGIRQNSNSQSSRPVDSFILDRVEILKGPASLLYGEGAIGGAVNLVSKSPISQVLVDGLLSYGSFGSYRAGIGVNVPLKPNLLARIDVSRTGTDGYVGDSPQELNAAAGSIRWLPTPNFVLTGRATYTYDDTSAYYATPLIDGQFDARTTDINYNMEDRLTKSHNRWAQVEAQALLGGGWQFRNHLFASTHKLDWRNFEGYAYNEATGLVDVRSYFLIWRNDLLVGNRADVRNAFRIAGRDLSFVAGGEIQRNDMERAGTPPGTSITRSLDPFDPQPHFDPGLEYVRQRDVLIDTGAVFAEGVYEAADRVKLVGGLRWERIGLDYTPFPSQVTDSTDYTPATGRMGAVVELTPLASAYVSYSRAVEPTTQLVSLDGSQQEFSLVPGRQIEAGAKGMALGGRLEGTLAYFDIEKRDLLITAMIDGVRTNQQIGRQSSRGVELTLVGRPSGTLTIAGDVAFTDAVFDEFIAVVANQNVSWTGNVPRGVPRIIWNVSPTQHIGPAYVTGTLRHVGERWGDDANSRRVEGYTTVDAAAGVRLGDGSRLTVRVRNLTDRLYTQSTSDTSGRLEPPRAIDVTFSTRFAGF